MADSIVRLTVNSSEYDQKLKRAAEGLTRYADECRKVGGTLEVVEKETLEYVRAIGQMETHSRTATGKLNEMKQSFVEFSSIYRNMTEQEKQSPLGKALAESLDQLKVRINDSKIQLTEINAEIGETGKMSDNTDISLKGLANTFGLNIDKLTSIGGALILAKGAFDTFTDAMMSSRETADNLGRDIQGLESIYNSFLISINNGDISGFLGRIQEIVNAARGAYDALSELQEFNAFNRINVQKARTDLNNAITDYRGGTATKEQVQQANEILKNELKERSAREQAVYEETIKQVAQEYKTNAEDLKNLLAGNYMDWHNQKHSNWIGSGTAFSSMPMGTMAGMWNGASPVFARNTPETSDERLSVLARTIPLERLDQLQQLGQQAEATNTEISQLDKSLSRLLNGKQGGGGNTPLRSGGSDRGGSIKTDQTELQKNQQTINTLTQEYVNISDNANEATRARQEEIQKEIQLLEQRNNLLKLYAQQAQGKLQGGDIQTTGLGSGSFWGSFKDMKIEGLSEDQMEKVREGMKKINQTANESKKSFSLAATAVNAMGSALGNIKDPGVQIMAMVGQAVASIALGFAQASAKEGKGGIWYWIAATAAGLATMVATISSIHSATGYAQGGIVEGNSYSGDNMMFGGDGLYGLNAGELVLTKAQQNSLAQTLSGNGLGNINVTGRLNGTDILLSADRAAQASGRGQLVTWK